MKTRIILYTLLLNTLMFVGSSAQDLPLVYDVENTGADFPKPPLPSFSQLPAIKSLPDPFRWSDSTRERLSVRLQWKERRAEIGAEIQNYEIGEKPVRPDTIKASYSGGVLTVNVTKNGQTLTLTSQVILPTGTGPFPAVIGMNSPNGSIPSTIFSSRNIARITFNHNQVSTYGNPQLTNPYYKLYPHLNLENTGQYSAWAWGISRIIDGMEMVKDSLPIDLKHLCVTGCSYAGKMAIFAGAFDERVALTIGQESGGGGYTTWRVSASIGGVEQISSTDYNWFRDSLKQFSGSLGSKLPYDHHELMAMVAPRALFVTGNPDYVWLGDESGHVGSKAAKEVWKALGVPDRFGYSIVSGHSHCAVPTSQIAEIEAFVDKFLLGNTAVNTDISTTPYHTDLSKWITWETPPLYDDAFYLECPSLIYPPNLQVDLDTTVTFQWSKVKIGEKYFVQLSTDPIFGTIDIVDSTTTDTSKTITGLLGGKNYSWRVRAKSIAGALGPWTNLWRFSTKRLTSAKEEKEMPTMFSLSQNYPNPFNPSTVINYQLPVLGYVSLKVYDLPGREVATLFEGVRQPGNYETTFDASGLKSGVYFYRLQTKTGFMQTRKLVLLK
jgi:hypothetical protein